MKFTETRGNQKNGITGTRVRVWATLEGRPDELMGEVLVNSRYGLRYVQQHPTGRHGREFTMLFQMAAEREQAMEQDEQQRREWSEHDV